MSSLSLNSVKVTDLPAECLICVLSLCAVRDILAFSETCRGARLLLCPHDVSCGKLLVPWRQSCFQTRFCNQRLLMVQAPWRSRATTTCGNCLQRGTGARA